jgi:cytidylate kinase
VKFHCVIAIDGPAASGKSSVARELARRLGFVYVNSGAFYRAITWHVLQCGIRPDDVERMAASIRKTSIVCELSDNQSRILIDDVDPTPHLRDDPVNNAVSQVSTVAAVRRVLTEKMRDYARTHDVVVEGRDIGSVVFPDTPYKFYIDALPQVRLRRRAAEGLFDEIATRDQVDSSRRASPLIISKDAHVIDSSNLTIEDVVGEIVGRLKLKGLEGIA